MPNDPFEDSVIVFGIALVAVGIAVSWLLMRLGWIEWADWTITYAVVVFPTLVLVGVLIIGGFLTGAWRQAPDVVVHGPRQFYSAVVIAGLALLVIIFFFGYPASWLEALS